MNDAPYDMQIYFKSLPQGTHTLQELEAFLRREVAPVLFGAQVTRVVFHDDKTGLGRLSGFLHVNRIKAAWNVVSVLNRRVICTANGGKVYMQAQMQSQTRLEESKKL
jgi:hypothetical protein